MKILALSAYDAASHQHWHKVLMRALCHHEWTLLTLPARYFNWRIRSNGLTWSHLEHEKLTASYDLCLATSMVDLATLRGLVPSLSAIPTMLYFHENQAAYPNSKQASRQLEPLMVQLYSSLAADQLCFNSLHNQTTFLEGLGATLKKFPDGVPKGVIEKLASKSCVLPVPIDLPFDNDVPINNAAPAKDPNTLVWNHRWEYDKGPDRLLAFVEALPENLPLTIHVIGQGFRQVPDAFDRIHTVLKKRGWLGEWGYIEDSKQYQQLLARTTYVLSTAEHDFQGLSILEAVARGCLPIVPDRLAYQEIFPEAYRYMCDENIVQESRHMVDMFCRLHKQGLHLSGGKPSKQNPLDITAFSTDVLKVYYDTLFHKVSHK